MNGIEKRVRVNRQLRRVFFPTHFATSRVFRNNNYVNYGFGLDFCHGRQLPQLGATDDGWMCKAKS